ncbi:uncharacterized protein LOC143618100 [Bidens hawaiensis]|uniref:uncharacterized protein LOC143618100 n=1 Tax=Bidens hawaiensis TaxID=980011 RepID=UPI00404A24FB
MVEWGERQRMAFQNAQNKLPVIVWMVKEASQGDLAVGLHLWSRLILPIVGTKSGSNPQIVERIIIVQATERFEAVYPTLKKVALAATPAGSKAMKQVYQQIINISLSAYGEGMPELSNEASNIFIWCLTQYPEEEEEMVLTQEQVVAEDIDNVQRDETAVTEEQVVDFYCFNKPKCAEFAKTK